MRCHRSAPTKPSTTNVGLSAAAPSSSAPSQSEGAGSGIYTAQRSKKVGCPFILHAKLVDGDDGDVEIECTPLHGHFNHTPGDVEDRAWLPLEKDVENRVLEVGSLFQYAVFGTWSI